jgi:hypothetical protein
VGCPVHFKFYFSLVHLSISYLPVLPLFSTNDLYKHVQSSLQVRLCELLLLVSRCFSSSRNRISLTLLASNRDSNFGVCLTNSTCHGAPMLHLACQWIDHPLGLGFQDWFSTTAIDPTPWGLRVYLQNLRAWQSIHFRIGLRLSHRFSRMEDDPCPHRLWVYWL